jgi:uncharacterized protein
VNVRTNSRYESEVDRRTAIATYPLKGNIVTFIHTEAPPEIGSHGAVARLIAGALEDVRAHGRKFRSLSPLVTSYAQRHPEVHDLLAGRET